MEFHRGDIYYVNRGRVNESGSEQRSGRPAIIVSNDLCNKHSSVLLMVYLTTKPKTDLPTHVQIYSAPKPGIALCEQVVSIDKDRIGSFAGKTSPQEMEQVDAALKVALSLSDLESNGIVNMLREQLAAAYAQIDVLRTQQQEILKLLVERGA